MIYIILALVALNVLLSWVVVKQNRMLDDLSDKYFDEAFPIDADWQEFRGDLK